MVAPRVQFVDVDTVHGPAVRSGHRAQLGLRFRKRDVQAGLAAPRAFHEELHRDRRLAGTGNAFQQVDAVRRKPAVEDGVEAGDAGGHQGRRRCLCRSRRSHAWVKSMPLGARIAASGT